MVAYTVTAKYVLGPRHIEQYPPRERGLVEAIREYFGVEVSLNTIKKIVGTSAEGHRPGSFNFVHCAFSAIRIDVQLQDARRKSVFTHKSRGADRGVKEDPSLDKAYVYKYFYTHHAECIKLNPAAFDGLKVYVQLLLNGSPVADTQAVAAFKIAQDLLGNLKESDFLIR